MRILFLAPQPFFVERGTPIAVKLALQVLGARGRNGNAEHCPLEFDLLTYHEGRDLPLASVRHHRISAPAWLRDITPGVSLKKLVCDGFFLLKALGMAWRNRRQQYVLVHAVEEAVFVALLLKTIFGIPFLYDMDSNLARQTVEKWPHLKWIEPLLRFFERAAVRRSIAVVPVCDSLAEVAMHYGSREVAVLRDVSLLSDEDPAGGADLHAELDIPSSCEIIVYIGNLEKYQGIDLLLGSFAHAAASHLSSHLVIVGGSPAHVAHYRTMAQRLGIAARVHLLGAKPLDQLNHYITQAHILASPRIKGENTPMKIYSYLHSGRAILATRLRTHTQVLDDSVALLCEPTIEAFATGLLTLLENPERSKQIGANAKRLAEENYTLEVFTKRLNTTYDRLIARVKSRDAVATAIT